MKTYRFLALIFVLISLFVGIASANDDSSRAANIAAFKTYLQGKEHADTLLESNQITFPAYYKRRIQFLQQIDRNNIDRKLNEFFESRIRQLKEELPLAKLVQADGERLDESLDATGGMLGAAVNGSLGYFVGKTMQTELETGAKQYMSQYQAQFDHIDALYDRRNKELLGLLSIQYDYPFLSIIYDEE